MTATGGFDSSSAGAPDHVVRRVPQSAWADHPHVGHNFGRPDRIGRSGWSFVWRGLY